MNNTEDKTDDRQETGGAAFPNQSVYGRCQACGWDENPAIPGMTLRQYAAVHLRIPESDIDWLDEMITKAEHRDVSLKVFQAVYAQGFEWNQIYKNVDDVVAVILKAKEK